MFRASRAGITRLLRLFFLIAAALLLQDSPALRLFTNIPTTTARWEIDSQADFHIGEIITATLYITHPIGTRLDLTRLPAVADVFTLPPKVLPPSDTDSGVYDLPAIPEGELEVVSRHITQSSHDSQDTIKVEYELQYLLPLDLAEPLDAKNLPMFVWVYHSYQRLSVKTGATSWRTDSITAEMVNFHLAPRITATDQPIFDYYQLSPPGSVWPALYWLGFGFLVLAFGLTTRQALGLFRNRRRAVTVVTSQPTIDELYRRWQEQTDPAIFTEAVKLYRTGVWGRPQTTNWITSTFILYSGVALSDDQIRTVFDRLIKEVTDVSS